MFKFLHAADIHLDSPLHKLEVDGTVCPPQACINQKKIKSIGINQ
jgi:hypothetical protein